MGKRKNMRIAVLGGGVAGLTTAHQLNKANKDVVVYEKDSTVGGLCKTINLNGNRFDFGGHRFWTKKEYLNNFLKDPLKDELIYANRSSKIYFNGKFVDYPLKFSALFSLGLFKTFVAGVDFLYRRLVFHLKKDPPNKSFEDYMVRRFGYQLYKYFFKEYTEKIWGIPCKKLSGEWAVQRIKGLSITSIIKNMIKSDKNVSNLTKTFFYPRLGISRIPEKLAEGLNVKYGGVKDITHTGNKILAVNGEKSDLFISTIPITELALMLNPPKDVIHAVNSLKYRDLVIVFLVFKGKPLTKESWIYFPDHKTPFGRFHEPRNWSPDMCRKGESSVVLEFFSSEGDKNWKAKDKDLINASITHLQKMGLWKNRTVTDSKVIRVKKCYPMYEVGYEKPLLKIRKFLSQFENLILIGRTGSFKYLNIDHVLEVGIKCADNILNNKKINLEMIGSEKEYQEIKKDNIVE
jgi:protoporphyrinogen oxidase